MKTKYPELKQILKEQSLKIRKMKSERCAFNCGYVYGLMREQFLFRLNHVAYCMLHGTPYERIEKPGENNPIQMDLVDKRIQKYKDLRDEALRASLQDAV